MDRDDHDPTPSAPPTVPTATAPAAMPAVSGFAIASLVIGIVGIATCSIYGLPSLVLGPLAVVFGVIAIRRAKRGGASRSTRGLAIAGIACGAVALALGVTIMVLLYFTWLSMGTP